MTVHADEIPIDEVAVRQLVAEQFPQWRGHPVRAIPADGTVNAIFRIGDSLAARFPRTVTTVETLENEAAAMREFAEHSPIATPEPVAIGAPAPGYPLPWSIQTWLQGDVATPDTVAHSTAFAHELADLLHALRAADTRGRRFSGQGRGGDLKDSDEWMQVCFRESEGLFPVDRLRDLWDVFRVLPPSAPDVMTHGDLTPPNLLLDGQRLVGVLDAGGFAPADPALDLVSAWHLLEADARAVLRRELNVDDLEWRRGAAWAFQQSMGLVWYYRETLPSMSALGRSTLARILADPTIR